MSVTDHDDPSRDLTKPQPTDTELVAAARAVLVKRANALAAERDELRRIAREFKELSRIADRAHQDLESAIDTLSELV